MLTSYSFCLLNSLSVTVNSPGDPSNHWRSPLHRSAVEDADAAASRAGVAESVRLLMNPADGTTGRSKTRPDMAKRQSSP